MRKLFGFLFILVFISPHFAQDNSIYFNLQFHYDIKRDHPTVTQEFLVPDNYGLTYSFMDLNFDHYRKAGGVSDFYFEIMRYFRGSVSKKRQYIVLINLIANKIQDSSAQSERNSGA